VVYENDHLPNLSGLNEITSIGGGLWINNNNALTSLSGLDNIISIGDYLRIRNNDPLSDITALSNVNYVGGDLTIYNNNELTNLSGLEGIDSIGGDLSASANNSLTSLTGLDNITSMGGYLSIKENILLPNLMGLNEITFIGGYLWISENISLTSISALENLTSIGGSLRIGDYYGGNPALTSLTGLENIDPGSISKLYIENNSSLSICDVYSICEYLISPNAVTNIHDNTSGCDSAEEVIDSCIITSVSEIITEEILTLSPNPLESTSVIKYTIQFKSPVTIKIFDLTGQEIVTLVNGIQKEGKQQITLS